MSAEQSPNPFLNRLHATFAASEPTVAELVRRATGRVAVAIERVVRGYANEVYRAHVGDRAVFVRIKRFGEETTFAGELWAMDAARSVGVPVPEVLLAEHVVTEQGDRPAMVLAAATGMTIDDLAQHRPADRTTALNRAGEVLARLHTMPAPGFWRPAADASWPLQDWNTLMDGFIADRAAERGALLAVGFTDPEVDHMLDLITVYARDYPCLNPVLCHGDFTPDHVFVDPDLRVSAVIDFGMYAGGPAVGNLALLNFNRTTDNVDAILVGYGNQDPDFRRAINLHTIGLAIGHVAHHMSIGDTHAAADLGQALQATLSRL